MHVHWHNKLDRRERRSGVEGKYTFFYQVTKCRCDHEKGSYFPVYI